MEGLLAYQLAVGSTPALAESLQRAEEYFLDRHLFHSLTSGKPITLDKMTGKPAIWTQLAYPWMWHHDVLRGLEYFRSAGRVPDKRLAPAITVVKQRQHQNGRWPRNAVHRDPVQLEMEGPKGTASRWNTLRAYRVLDWNGNV
jgi:hypothetical protein